MKKQYSDPAYIGLGTNLGDKKNNLTRAIGGLARLNGVRVIRHSGFYPTAPLGYTNQPAFLNAAVEIRTSLAPEQLFRGLKSLEHKLGRKRQQAVRWGPRVIDLDILFYGDAVIKSPELVVPHPRLHERRFVLEPLSEIAPALMHPVYQKTVRKLLETIS